MPEAKPNLIFSLDSNNQPHAASPTNPIPVTPGAEVLATNQFSFTLTNSNQSYQILPANPNRRSVQIQNPDTGNSAWIHVGGTAATVGAPSWKLPAVSGVTIANLRLDVVGQDAVYAMTNVGPVTIVVIETYAVGV